MLRAVFALCFSAALIAQARAATPLQSSDGLVPRQVAAPASDLEDGTLRLPAPAEGAVRSWAAMESITWRPDGVDRWRGGMTLPVAAGSVGIAAQGFGAAGLQLELRMDGERLPLFGPMGTKRTQLLAPELGGEEVVRWDVQVESGGLLEAVMLGRGSSAPAPTVLVVRDGQSVAASAYVDSQRCLSNEPLFLVARFEGADGATLRAAGATAWAQLSGPGFDGRVAMSDDGLSGDGAAGDGLFGVQLPLGLSGSYAARVELAGRLVGHGVKRTTRVTFDVAEPLLELTGEVTTRVLDARRLRLDIGALPLADAKRIQVSAEVWGTDPSGQMRPMAWLSRIDEPRQIGGAWSLPLWLDARWFAATGLAPAMELRNVRVQDPDHLGVLAGAERLAVPQGPLPPMAGRVHASVAQLTGFDVNASVPALPDAPSVLINPGLVLSHGYCSGGNVWPDADFTGSKLAFSDPNQNRSHDQFANLIASQAAAFSSFGVVGHSQGGNAALHLLTFYQSPLDRSIGPRRIQSVGSPYQGTPLASLGFFACGVNNNLTTGGASTWLASIPTWARAEVHYYTTANDGAACQLLTALLLSNPEDGTTENARGQLPGANNMGFVTGWCHTTAMSDPPQYRDSARNAVMDAQAAR